MFRSEQLLRKLTIRKVFHIRTWLWSSRALAVVGGFDKWADSGGEKCVCLSDRYFNNVAIFISKVTHRSSIFRENATLRIRDTLLRFPIRISFFIFDLFYTTPSRVQNPVYGLYWIVFYLKIWSPIVALSKKGVFSYFCEFSKIMNFQERFGAQHRRPWYTLQSR